MKIPHPDLFCLNPAPLPRIFQKTRQAKSNFAEKKSKYLLRRIENQNHDRGEASSNGENQGSPPSRNQNPPRDQQLTQEVNEYFKEPRLDKPKSKSNLNSRLRGGQFSLRTKSLTPTPDL